MTTTTKTATASIIAAASAMVYVLTLVGTYYPIVSPLVMLGAGLGFAWGFATTADGLYQRRNGRGDTPDEWLAFAGIFVMLAGPAALGLDTVLSIVVSVTGLALAIIAIIRVLMLEEIAETYAKTYEFAYGQTGNPYLDSDDPEMRDAWFKAECQRAFEKGFRWRIR